MEPRLGQDLPDGAEAQHERLLGLVHGEQRGEQQGHRGRDEKEGAVRGTWLLIGRSLAGALPLGGCAPLQLVERQERQHALARAWSMTTLSIAPRTRSIVSRKMRSRITSGALRYSS